MANSATRDCGLSLQDTDDGNDATKSGDLVDLLWSQLQYQQSENPQSSSKSTVKDSGLLSKDQFDEHDGSTLRHLVTNLPLNFTSPQLSESSDELHPPETETAQLTSDERIQEETCSQTVNRIRCGASAPNVYSRPDQPASSMKPFGADVGMPIEMSDGHISSYRQDTSCVAPDPIMEAEQETNRASFSGVVSPISAMFVWSTNSPVPQAQCDSTRAVRCVEQNMHKNMKQTVQSSNGNKEDDPCGSGLRLLEQLNHAGGSNMASNPAPQYHVTTTTSSNVPTANGAECDNLLQTEDFIKDIKGARYTQGGKYISGHAESYEELETVVARHAQITKTNWDMDKLVSVRLTGEDCIAILKRFNSSMKPRLFWMTNKGEPNILCDGVPFATGSIEKTLCKHSSQQRSKDVSLCKCDARIYVRSIWRFPSFPLRIAGNAKKSDKQTHMELLSVHIAAGEVTPVECYYFSLPTAWAHTSHKVPEFPRPGPHFTPLHPTLVKEIQRLLQAGTGNTFITEVTEHIAQFAECNLEVELALNPSDESLQVSREKVNRHIYHMLKDGEITLPVPLSVLTEEQIRCTHFPDQEPSGTLPACSNIQDSSGGEEDLDPCGDDQEWGEQLGDEGKIALDGERKEVCCLLNLLGNQAYATQNKKCLQELRRILTDASCYMSDMLCTKPSPSHLRKRSTNTTDTPLPKKTSLGSPSPLACS